MDDTSYRIGDLNARAHATEKRLDSIENKLDTLLERSAKQPTIAGMWGMIATVIGIAVAVAFGTFAVADYASKRPSPSQPPAVQQQQ